MVCPRPAVGVGRREEGEGGSRSRRLDRSIWGAEKESTHVEIDGRGAGGDVEVGRDGPSLVVGVGFDSEDGAVACESFLVAVVLVGKVDR